MGGGTISSLAEETHRFSKSRGHVPPRRVLSDVGRLERCTRSLLPGGRQRLRQTRELFRIEADLLADSCILLGDLHRNDPAMSYGTAAVMCAEEAAQSRLSQDSGASPWSCRRPRQALYALSVALQAGNPEEALQAARMAGSAWGSGGPRVPATWAQIRFGAANAFVMMGDLHGAAEQIAPVMSMPPEFRMSTVTNYLVELDARLDERRFQGSDVAASLREQTRDFISAALSAVHPGEDA